MAHAYTARAVNRAIVGGVRSIEHGNLIDETSVELFVKHGTFYVPTLSTYNAIKAEGLKAGFPPELLSKLDDVLVAGGRALAMAYDGGFKMVYGTGLLGDMHRHQLKEFGLRAKVVSAAELIRSATCNAAELFGMQGEIGTVSVGARADLLVVDRDPLRNISVLEQPEKHLKAVMKDGQFFHDLL